MNADPQPFFSVSSDFYVGRLWRIEPHSDTRSEYELAVRELIAEVPHCGKYSIHLGRAARCFQSNIPFI